MVQLFYYDILGKSCRKILKYQGQPSKIHLFGADEGCLPNGLKKYWILKTAWWSRSWCQVTEVVAGQVKRKTKAHMANYPRLGVMYIEGRFDDDKVMPDFCLRLTSDVSREDFRAGYSMCGTANLF